MNTFLLFLLAALCEIAGCFAFWCWYRLDQSALWTIPGALSLLAFAVLLSRAETAFAGRAYAAYGGVYIAASLAWLFLVEGQNPDRWDLIGVTICLTGTAVILWGPR